MSFQGAWTWRTLPSPISTLGIHAWRKHWYWKKLRCRQVFWTVSYALNSPWMPNSLSSYWMLNHAQNQSRSQVYLLADQIVSHEHTRLLYHQGFREQILWLTSDNYVVSVNLPTYFYKEPFFFSFNTKVICVLKQFKTSGTCFVSSALFSYQSHLAKNTRPARQNMSWSKKKYYDGQWFENNPGNPERSSGIYGKRKNHFPGSYGIFKSIVMLKTECQADSQMCKIVSSFGKFLQVCLATLTESSHWASKGSRSWRIKAFWNAIRSNGNDALHVILKLFFNRG